LPKGSGVHVMNVSSADLAKSIGLGQMATPRGWRRISPRFASGRGLFA
jgi:hypothetical protein